MGSHVLQNQRNDGGRGARRVAARLSLRAASQICFSTSPLSAPSPAPPSAPPAPGCAYEASLAPRLARPTYWHVNCNYTLYLRGLASSLHSPSCEVPIAGPDLLLLRDHLEPVPRDPREAEGHFLLRGRWRGLGPRLVHPGAHSLRTNHPLTEANPLEAFAPRCCRSASRT